MPIIYILELSDFIDVLRPGNSIVDFSAEWCGPCKRIAPKFHQLSEEWTNVRFYTVDVDDVEEIHQEFDIQSIPTFMLFKDGETVSKFSGASISKIVEELQEHFGP